MVRMSETEALMWSVEKDPALRSDFCNLTIVDGPIDLERLRHALRRAIAAVPRLGQRVVEPPLKVTTPEWVAVEHLDLDDHLHVVELPAPGDERTLLDFCAAYAETPFDRAVPLLAPRGRFVLMAGRDARPTFPVGPFYVKDCSLHGFAMFNAMPDEQRPCAADLNRWLAAGQVRANIDRVLPLAAAAAEKQRLELACLDAKRGMEELAARERAQIRQILELRNEGLLPSILRRVRELFA